MSKIMGTTSGVNVALALTGVHASTVNANLKSIGDQANGASGKVSGFADVQKTMSFQLAQAKDSIEAAGISLGLTLLPAVSAVLRPLASFLAVIAGNRAAAIAFAVVVGGVLAAAVGTKAVHAFQDMAGAMKDVWEGVEKLSKKLLGLGKSNEEAGAAAKKSAAVQAEAAEEGAAAQEEAAGEAAAANDEAAAESSGSWIASAASTLAAWAATAAGMVAQAAVWVATNTAKVAVVVAENVAGAAMTLASWIAANAAMSLGIGLIVIAIVAAVVLIVKHWKQISHAVAEVWDEVVKLVKTAVGDVVKFVKEHWVLLAAIILGPVALAAIEIAKHWKDIRRWFSEGVRDVERILSWFTGLPAMFGRWIAGAASAVWSAGVHFLEWYVTLPVKIVEHLSGLPGKMLSIGENIVKGIWNGISGAAGWLAGKITGFGSSIIGDIGSAFGISSPSKKTYPHGMFLGMGLGNGFVASIPYVTAAARRVASAVLGVTSRLAPGSVIGSALAGSAVGPAAGYGGGPLEITIRVEGDGPLTTAIGDSLKVYVRERGGGGPYSAQKAFGRRWPSQ